MPSRRERNDFYTRAGRLIPPGRPGLTLLRTLDADVSPSNFIAKLEKLTMNQ
jgi:hypothetical protein